MSEVNVLFGGIVTHIVEPGRARSVLVNASQGMSLMDKKIPPHTALLRIKPEFIAENPGELPGMRLIEEEGLFAWVMEGVALQFEDTVPGIEQSGDFSHVPSLMQAVNSTLPLPLDPRVVEDGLAAARFDTEGGRFDAFKVVELDNAVHTHLTLTVLDRQPPTLRITRIWDGSSGTIVLTPSAWIRILNIGKESDHNIDFALHYGVTTFTPTTVPQFVVTDVREGTEEEKMQLGPFVKWQLTLGCSNSNFP